MTLPRHLTTALAILVVLFTGASRAAAQEWNDRTILEFSEAVAVPGATLEPGRYEFRLADSDSARHVVRIFKEQDDTLITTVHAIPMYRNETTGDIVVRFNPAERGQAPAMKGWFYPGQRYGHEFVYSEADARQIAERTKTLVLSGETSGDMQSGTLHVIDPSGTRRAWQEDSTLTNQWKAWNRSRRTANGNSASMIQADFKGMRVKLDDLEDRPTQYIGKQVSVDAEIESVLGPRLFKIDEPGWADLEGEFLVVMPTSLAALVKPGDRVTVSGTVRQFVRAEVEREWGWLDTTPDIELDLARKPVIVADRIIGGDTQRTMMIEAGRPSARSAGADAGAADGRTPATAASSRGSDSDARPVGTAGVGMVGAAPLEDVTTVATGDNDLVGRPVHLDNVTVTAVQRGRGFFVGPRERQLFVLTQFTGDSGHQGDVSTGQQVSLDGFVMQMPTGIPDTLDAAGALNRHIYVYATELK